MKVLVFGHSYVRDLCHLKPKLRNVAIPAINTVAEVFYRYYPGKDYDYFGSHPEEFDYIQTLQPDIFIVVFGGNLIVEDNSNSYNKQVCQVFFEDVKKYLPSHCKVLVGEVEHRFCAPNNYWGAPEVEEFQRRRRNLNNFVRVKLKRRKLVDSMMLIGATGGLDNVDMFKRDGVHLTESGLKFYRQVLVNTIKYHAVK